MERVNLYIQPSKKCLVLDCDNTLWKGVLGEDGLTELRVIKISILDQSSRGTNMFLELKNAGVILCLNSKNNLEDVRHCFSRKTCH